MAYAVPPEVQQFIQGYIRSLDQLEILLLVSGLPDRDWTAGAVYAAVLSNPAVVAAQLEHFVKIGVLAGAGEPASYRYSPKNEKLAEQIASLRAAYRVGRHKIVELIYSQPPDSLINFSEAFKFKRNK